MAKLVDFVVSERQRQAVQAMETHGTLTKAANALGINRSSLTNLVKRAQRQAAIRGWSPDHDMVKTVPEPFVVKGTSTLYDETGVQKLQWVKTSVEHEKLLAIMREVVDELKTDVKPLKPIKRETKQVNEDLLTLYTLSDAHIGMLAWHEDGGADWDVGIAEQVISDAFDSCIAASPDSEVGFFAQLGDGLHYDGMVAETPRSKHKVDADSRNPKMVRAAVRIFRNATARLLQKHRKVVVLMAQGNHDEGGSVWLQTLWSILFEDNPRVEVIVSSNPFYAYHYGNSLLGFYHGQDKKPEELPAVFSNQFRELHGKTKRTYIHCGHRHSQRVIECGSTLVQQHPTVSARDAYASHHGYFSSRAMLTTTYHKRKCKVSEVIHHVEID